MRPSIRPNVASISTTPVSSLGLPPVLLGIDVDLAVLAIPVHPTYTERWEAPLGLLETGTVDGSLCLSSTTTFWTT